MKDVNRYALLVQPRQTLLDWVNTIFPESPVSMDVLEDDDGTVYLIPQFIGMQEARSWLRKHFKPILEQELEDWCTDQSLWPALSWKTFESMLDYRIYGVVLEASAPDRRGKKQSVPNSPKGNAGGEILEIEIYLNDSQPKIWRCVHIAPNTTFLELHYIIQFAMGWTNSHLHQFIIGDRDVMISVPFLMEESPFEYLDSKNILVADFLCDAGDKLIYEYDFGDSWYHTITLIKHIPRLPEMALPIVVDGARACPPEDVGGIWGYQGILKALKHPRSREGKLYADWRETNLDPERFDLAETNDQYFKHFKRVMAEWERYANS